jgi:3-oxoadipate enol-lactonase
MTTHSDQDHIVDHVTSEGWRSATEERLVTTDFGQLLVRVGGNVRGRAMVFWPSLLLDASMWRYQFEHYAPNYKVVLIDPPGIGKSAVLRRVISVEESATCLRQVLDALHIEKSIVVSSTRRS